MDTSKHIALFKGEVVRKIYYSRKFMNFMLESERYEHIQWKDVIKCELDMPLVEPGERIYINELDETVRVSSRVRSTSGEVIYYIDCYEVIEDELSQKSKETMQEEIKQFNNLGKELSRQISENAKSKKWWQI